MLMILNCCAFAGGHGHQKRVEPIGEDDRESDRLNVGYEFWRRECRLDRRRQGWHPGHLDAQE